jgi:hypothetical protein
MALLSLVSGMVVMSVPTTPVVLLVEAMEQRAATAMARGRTVASHPSQHLGFPRSDSPLGHPVADPAPPPDVARLSSIGQTPRLEEGAVVVAVVVVHSSSPLLDVSL